ncbi:MAG: DUF4403 family protein [Chitinophagales bacterium]|jgi:hypothetical protein|nr:DUF4403 family protein [Chitinophagales bacterium]
MKYFFIIIYVTLSSRSHAQNIASAIVPISISYKTLEKKLNQIPNPIYMDTSMLGITQYLSISILPHTKITKSDDDKIYAYIPLRSLVTLSSFGKILKQIDFDMLMQFEIELQLSKNYGVISKTRFVQYKFIGVPKLKVFQEFGLNLSNIVDNQIQKNKLLIVAQIDASIRENAMFKPQFQELWNSFEEPVLLDSLMPLYWKMSPQQAYASPLMAEDTGLKFHFGLDFLSQSYIGQKSIDPIKPLNPLYIKSMPEAICRVITENEIPISFLDSFAKANFRHSKYLFDKPIGDSVQITDISMQAKENKLETSVQLTGGLKGTFIMLNALRFDSSTRNIILDEVSYRFQTKNIIHKAAAKIFYEKINNKLKENIYFCVNDKINLIKKNIEAKLNTRNSVYISQAQVTQIDLSDFKFESNFLTFKLNTNIHYSIHF